MIEFILVTLFIIFVISASGKARIFPPKQQEWLLARNARKREEVLRDGGWFAKFSYSDGLSTFVKTGWLILFIFLTLTIVF